MRKILKIVGTLLLIFAVAWLLGVAADRNTLSRELIRLHVVGASDGAADQAVKLQVRDAITAYLQPELEGISNAEQAQALLQTRLPELRRIAEETLTSAGFSDSVSVTLTQEAFPVRHYDSFSLPAGVYRSLRVRIGEAEGKNWWCVVFPSLCMPAAGEDFADTAAGAGFSDGLSGALKGEQTYRVRFYFLDILGKIQNFFFREA